MDWKELLTHVDHTLLKPEARWEDIRRIVDEGIHYGCASVCIPASYVSQAAQYAQGQVPICTVIGFPNGYSTAPMKAAEATNAVQNGAAEIDMVVNLGWVKDGLFQQVGAEIQTVKNACQGRILKVIIETCLLTEEEKIRMCQVVTEAGADFIKTSTGFSAGGATREDIALFKKYVGPQVRIKAAGGIKSFADARDFISLGASRLGTSRLVELAKKERG